MVYLLLILTDFAHCSVVSVDDFEKVNASWTLILKLRLSFESNKYGRINA